MSGLSLLLLNTHRLNPDKHSYATGQLQWAYGLASLDAAYAQLVEEGLMRETGYAMTVFQVPRPMYVLTNEGKAGGKAASIDALAIWHRPIHA
jgi:hypothetical protein